MQNDRWKDLKSIMGTQKIHSVFPVHDRKVMAADILSGAFQQYSLNSLRIYNHPQAIQIVELYHLPSNVCSGTTWASTFKIVHSVIFRYDSSIFLEEVTVLLEDKVKVNVMIPNGDRLWKWLAKEDHIF